MALAFVNRAENTVSGSPVASASTTAVSHTAGNLLVVFTNWQPGDGATGVTLADLAGNSYTPIGSTLVRGNNRLQLHYAANCLGHASNVVTVTSVTNVSAYLTVSVRQFSGASLSSVLDGIASDTGSSTSLDSGSVVVTAAQAAIVAGAEADGQPITAGSGYTLNEFAGGDGAYFADEYHIVTASESATMTSNSSGSWGICAAAFKVASGAGSPGFQSSGFQPNGFQEGSFFNPQSVVPGTLALVLTTFAPTVLNPQGGTPGTLALVLTPFVPTVLAYHNQSGFQTAFQGDAFQVGWQFSFVGAVPGTLALTLTPFVATVAATANQFVTPGTKSLVLTPFTPTVVATANKFVVPGTLALVLTKYAPTVVATGSRTAKNYGSGSEVMPQGKFKWSKAWEQKFAEDRMLAARERSKARFEDFDAFVLEQWREQEDSDLHLAASAYPW